MPPRNRGNNYHMPRWLIILIGVLVVLAILILLAEHVAFHVH